MIPIAPIIAMVSRDRREVRIAPTKNVTSKDIMHRALKNIDAASKVYHDEYTSYSILSGLYDMSTTQ
ncbi:MAG: transposase [Nitrososphaerales archaeon]